MNEAMIKVVEVLLVRMGRILDEALPAELRETLFDYVYLSLASADSDLTEQGFSEILNMFIKYKHLLLED